MSEISWQKKVVKVVMKIIAAPSIPFIALGYWAASDTYSYIEAIKECWND